MGKVSEQKTTPKVNIPYIPHSSGTVNVNGRAKANVGQNAGAVYSNYTMSPQEKQLYDYAQQTLRDALPKVNVFSDDVKNDLASQVEAYKKQGLHSINSTYTPMIENLKNDISSRFGNFDNSMFMNKLAAIENNRANAMAALENDLLTRKSDLYDAELSRRYNQIGTLKDIQDTIDANIMTYLNMASGLNDSGRAFNKDFYNSIVNNSATSNVSNTSYSNSTLTNLLAKQALSGLLGGFGGGIL